MLKECKNNIVCFPLKSKAVRHIVHGVSHKTFNDKPSLKTVLESHCSKHDIRVAKVIRVCTLSELEYIVDRIPEKEVNLKVFYLVRDPRVVGLIKRLGW